MRISKRLAAVLLLAVGDVAFAGTIAGSVTEFGSGLPITDGRVVVYGQGGDYLGLASIGNDGAYSYSGLAAGTYFARTEDTGYQDELWNDLPCAQRECIVTSGTPITVGAGSTTPADFALAPGATIVGTVTGPGGQAVTDGYAEIYGALGGYLGLASLGSGGTYSYGGLAAGNYFVRTSDTGLLDELWNDIPCAQGDCNIASGTLISVAAGTVPANFALQQGGIIEGMVTVTGSGYPIADGYITLFDENGDYLGLASIGNDGSYRYGGLAAGNYYARTEDTGFGDELWNNMPCAQGDCEVTSGTPIPVANNGTTIADFGLDSSGGITGLVMEDGSGHPVTDGYVAIYNSAGGYIGLAAIGNDGVYTYGGLAEGNYFARTTGTGVFDELWDGIPCAQGNCVITLGTPIPVGTDLTVANFSLDSGGTIRGTVTSTDTGQPIADGYVVVYDNTGDYIGLTQLSTDGTYAYGGLATGSYFARTENTGFIDELWNDIPCAQGACVVTSGTPIVVSGGDAVASFLLGESERIFSDGFE